MNRFLVTANPLDEATTRGCVDAAGAGGIVTFVGRVRDRARGHPVTRLEYEAYPEMAESVFATIAGETKSKFAVTDVAIHHRTGMLDVGEVSVVVVVCAAHRAPAFEGCRYAIDRLKAIAPIWKKEHGPDGAIWIEDRP